MLRYKTDIWNITIIYKNGQAVISNDVELLPGQYCELRLTHPLIDKNIITKSSFLSVKTTSLILNNSLAIYNEVPTSSSIALDYGLNNNGWVKFDISKVFDNDSSLEHYYYIKNESLMTINIYATQSSYVPVLEVNYYLNSTKINKRKCFDVNLSNDTNISVDMLGGRLFYNKSLFSGVTNFDLSLVYNNQGYSFYDCFLPTNFKVNLLEYYDTTNNILIDSNYNKIEFELVNNSSTIYHDKHGLGLLYDTSENKLFNVCDDSYKLFNSSGKITKIVDNLAHEINITYSSTYILIKSNLCAVKLSSNKIELGKMEKYLIILERFVSSGISYTFSQTSNGFSLTDTCGSSETNEVDNYTFSSGRISSISLNSETLNISYLADRVSSINKKGLNNKLIEKFDFLYNYLHFKVTNRKGVFRNYTFDEKLEQINEYEDGCRNSAIFSSNDLSNFYRVLSSEFNCQSGSDETITLNNIQTDVWSVGFFSGVSLSPNKTYMLVCSLSGNMLPNKYSSNREVYAELEISSTQKIRLYFGNLYGNKEVASTTFIVNSNVTITQLHFHLNNQKGSFYFRDIYITEVKQSTGRLYYQKTGGAFVIDQINWDIASDIVNGGNIISYNGNYIAQDIDLSLDDLSSNELSYHKNKNIYFWDDLTEAYLDSSGYGIKYGTLSNSIFTQNFIYGLYSTNRIKDEFNYHTLSGSNTSLVINENNIIRYNSSSYKMTKEYNHKMLLQNETDIDNITTTYTYDSNYNLTNKNNIFNQETYGYDTYNRLTSHSYYVGLTLATVYNQYLNNMMLIDKDTDPKNVETTYAYSTNKKYITSLTRNSITINTNYSLGRINSNNIGSENMYNYGYDNYLMLNQVSIYNNNNPLNIFNESHTLNANSNDDTYTYTSLGSNIFTTNFNKYLNIDSEVYGTYTNTYIYSDNLPSDIETSTPTVTLSSASKLYKMFDDYANVTTYFNYNDKGMLNYTEKKDSSNFQIIKEELTFDNLDRISTDNYTCLNTTHNNSYTYETIKNKILTYSSNYSYIYDGISYVNGILTTNTYYTNGLLNTKTHQFNYINSKYDYIYDSNSSIQSDLPKQVDFYHNSNYSPDNYIDSFGYNYDKYGNVTKYMLFDKNTSFSSIEITYIYDSNNRLVEERDIDHQYSVNYTYDSRGNILSAVKSESGITITDTFTYDSNYKDKLISVNNQTVSYDSNLNITSLLGNSYTYTRVNLLSSSTVNNVTTNYTYDKDRYRLTKHTSNETHYYYYINGKLIKEEIAGSNNIKKQMCFLYDNDEIIGYSYMGNTYLYKKNIFKDVVAIYLNGNTIISTYKYDGYGNVTVYDSNGNIDTNMSSIGNTNPIRYRSYYYDKETNMYYCHNRYYNPRIRRWMSIDDVSYLDSSIIDGLNLYAYCNNNPVMYSDGDGSFPILTLILAGTFALGFGSSLFMNAATNKWQLDWRDFLQAGVDGAFAVGATMLAMTGIGFAGSIAAGAAMGWSQYVIGAGIQGDSITLVGSLTAIGIGALGGAISGAGAANSANIGKNMIGLSDDGVRAIGAITNAANRKAAGIISAKGLQSTFNLYGKTAFNAVQAAIPGTMRRLFLSSARKIAFYTVLANASQSGLNYGYKVWGLI